MTEVHCIPNFPIFQMMTFVEQIASRLSTDKRSLFIKITFYSREHIIYTHLNIVYAAHVPSSADKGASGPPRRVCNHPGQH